MRNVSRKEKKFLVDMASAKQLEGLLSQVVPGDLHNGSHGYPVRSLYFDTLHDRDFAEKLFGTDPRRKVRLRVYDPTADFALLELKQKQGENQRKRSLPLMRAAKENKTRVTFDRNIRATELNQGLFDPKLPLYPVFDPFNVVLEVKFDGFLLSYIRSMLNMVDKSELSVSKYCLARSVRMAYQF